MEISKWEEYNPFILAPCAGKIFMKTKVSNNLPAHLYVQGTG